MNPPYIPATALSGDLIGGWTGPIEYQWAAGHWRAATLLGWPPFVENVSSGIDAGTVTIAEHRGRGRCVAVVVGCVESCTVRDGDIRLDPARPEVAHRIADVLRRKGHEIGHLLPVALGGRVGDAEVESDECTHEDAYTEPDTNALICRRCDEGENVRPVPAADVSAVVLAASVAGVEAGRGVVLGVVEPLDVTNCRLSCETYAGRTCYWTMDEATRNECRGPREIAPTFAGERDGWCWGDLYGPETGQAAIARIYAAVHAAGWARLDPAAPFGVVVPTFDLEKR